MRSTHAINFGPYRLDAINAQLWRGKQALSLPPKTFAVLCYLAEHPGRLVTKEELLDAVWGGRCVSEGVLKTTIQLLRKVLQDDSQAPRYIETRSRRGYRFISELTSAAPLPLAKAAPAPASSLVGREERLGQLRGVLEQALRGERQVVFVTGEPGIGKTALIEAFLQALGPRVRSLCGQCIEQYGQGEPYAPVLEALNSLAREAGEPLLRLMRQYAPTWLVQLPWFLADADRALLQREVLGATKERMLRELGEFLERWTAQCPLILVLEDLHWSDYATLDLISYLPKRADAARLMLIGTYRPVEVIVSGHPLKAVKQELLSKRQCKELPLEYLGEEAVAEYLAVRFPAHRFPAGLGGLIHERTEGNPLFMVNVVDYLVTEGLIAKAEEVWQLGTEIEKIEVGVPDSIKQMIEKQIGYLSKEEQRMLEAASVSGVEFSTLTVAAGLGEDAAVVEARCEELARGHQFIRDCGFHQLPDGEAAARYGFIHALYQNVLYERVSAAKRVHLHRRVGERGEELYGERAGEIAAELAMHFERGREHRRAVKYLVQATETAIRRFAHQEAIGYLTRALELVGRLPEAERTTVQMRLLEQRGLVRRAMDDMSAAVADFETLLTCAQQQGRAEAEVQAMIQLTHALFWLDRERSLEIAERALKRSGALQDQVLRAHAEANYASWTLMLRGWQDEEFRRFNAAREVISRSGPAQLRSEYTMHHAYLQFHRSRYLECYQTARQGRQLALEIGDAYHHISCQGFSIWALLHRGEWGETQRLASEGLKTSDANGLLLGSKFFRLHLAWLHLQAFAFEPARGLAEAGLEQARQSPYDNFATFFGLLLLGMAHLGLGQSARTRDYLDEIKQRAEAKPLVLDWLLQMPLYQLQSEYGQAVGDREQARQAAQHLCVLAGRPGERTYLAQGYRLLAEIALAEQHWEEAEADIARALAVLAGAEVPLAAWRVYATAAELNDRRGRTDEARAYWNRSAAIIHALANSLEPADPLRQSLLTAPPVQAILGRATSSEQA